MAQLYKIRLPNGNVLEPSDWTAAEPLYSSVEIGTAAFPVLTAYSYAIGGAVPGSPNLRSSTLADTNLDGEGARLPENEELVAYALAIEVFMIGTENAEAPDTLFPSQLPMVSLQNMLRLQRDLLVITKVAAVKEYTRSPLSWFPASTGVAEANSLAENGAGQGFADANNGGVSVGDIREFATPLYVKGGETLAVDVRPGPGQVNGLNLATSARMRLRFFFEGYRKRPVA